MVRLTSASSTPQRRRAGEPWRFVLASLKPTRFGSCSPTHYLSAARSFFFSGPPSPRLQPRSSRPNVTYSKRKMKDEVRNHEGSQLGAQDGEDANDHEHPAEPQEDGG